MKPDYEKINHIMDWFNFSKVAKTMKFLEWTWETKNGDKIPNESEIRERARKLLIELYEHDLQIIETSGFKITKDEDDSLRLMFYIADWEEVNDA